MSYFLGIDPGASGALAFYDPLTNNLSIFDMPTYSIKGSGKTKKTVIDLHRLAGIVQNLAKETTMAAVEEVGAMPGQGVTSMFSFGYAAGVVQMAVVGSDIPMHMVRPNVWKKAMGITKDKDGARRQASRLLPKHASKWERVKDDGRAEAALLALYLARTQIAMPESSVLDEVI